VYEEEELIQVWDVTHGQIERVYRDRGFILDVDATGQYIASDDTNNVYVWDIETGIEVGIINQEAFFRWGLALSQNANLIWTSSCDPGGGAACSIWSVKLWDTASGREIHNFNTVDVGRVADAAFSPSDENIVLASENGSVMVYNTATGQLENQFAGHKGLVGDIEYSADGRYILSVSSDSVQLWSFQEALIEEYQGTDEAITDISVSREGAYILSASNFGSLHVWDIVKQQEVMSTNDVGDVTANGNFAFSLDQASENASVWDMSNNADNWQRGVSVPRSNYSIERIETFPLLAISRDGTRLLMGGCGHVGSGGRCAYGTLVLWDIVSEKEIVAFEGHVGAPIRACLGIT
jgi:WD40 repeat protein